MNDEMSGDEYPVVNPAYLPVRANGVVHLRAGPWSGAVFTVYNEPERNGTKLFDLLDGKHTLLEIVESVGQHEDVVEIIEELRRENLLVLRDDESNFPGPRIPVQGGKPDVVRDRRADGRYRLVTYGDIGSIVADRLERTAHPVERTAVSGPEDVESMDVADADFLVYLSDRHTPKLAERLNERTLEAEVPWLVGQVNGFDAVVGPTIVPNETACYRCYRDRVAANVDDELYELYERGATLLDPDSVFSPLRYVVEAYVCMELSHLDQFGQGMTVERTFTVSAVDMTTRVNDVLKAPRCDACSDLADRKRFVGYDDVKRWRNRDE